MATSCACFLALVPFLLTGSQSAQQPPTEMTRMIVRLSGPGIKENSHTAEPKTIYRAGEHYARIEEAPDPRQQTQKVLIIAEPDAYSMNLADKTGTHAVDQGSPNDLHLPIVLPFDPKRKLQNLDRIEFGDEVEFFEKAGAAKTSGTLASGKAADIYRLDTPEGAATLTVMAGTDRPVSLSWQTPEGTYTYHYVEYEDVPFDPALFRKPPGITFREIPPDTNSDHG